MDFETLMGDQAFWKLPLEIHSYVTFHQKQICQQKQVFRDPQKNDGGQIGDRVDFLFFYLL